MQGKKSFLGCVNRRKAARLCVGKFTRGSKDVNVRIRGALRQLDGGRGGIGEVSSDGLGHRFSLSFLRRLGVGHVEIF